MIVRPHICAAPAASLTGKPRLQIRQPTVIRPSIAADSKGRLHRKSEQSDICADLPLRRTRDWALQAADLGLLHLSRIDRLAWRSFHCSSNRSSPRASLSQSSASLSHACSSSAPAAFALLRHSKALRQNSSGFDMIRNHRELSAPNPDELSFKLMIYPHSDAHQASMNARAPCQRTCQQRWLVRANDPPAYNALARITIPAARQL
jgi:hypothetical protein